MKRVIVIHFDDCVVPHFVLLWSWSMKFLQNEQGCRVLPLFEIAKGKANDDELRCKTKILISVSLSVYSSSIWIFWLAVSSNIVFSTFRHCSRGSRECHRPVIPLEVGRRHSKYMRWREPAHDSIIGWFFITIRFSTGAYYTVQWTRDMTSRTS